MDRKPRVRWDRWYGNMWRWDWRGLGTGLETAGGWFAMGLRGVVSVTSPFLDPGGVLSSSLHVHSPSLLSSLSESESSGAVKVPLLIAHPTEPK